MVNTVTNDDLPNEAQPRPEDRIPDSAESGTEAGTGADEPVRRERFDFHGILEIDAVIGAGRVTIALTDEPGITVEVRADLDANNPWIQGLSTMLHWFGGQFGDGIEGGAAAAIAETRIELSGQRLIVHTPKRIRLVPLAVTVRAPSGANLDLYAGSATVTVTGGAGRVKLSTGTGDVALDRADGPAEINAGSGALRLGPMLGGLRARNGSGEIEVSSVGGATSLITGSGDVWLGAVQSDVVVRTGSGDLTVADAAHGRVELVTGSGEIRVGVRAGTSAMVDLQSGSGQARSELGLSDRPPANAPTLQVRGRTGSGNAVVTAAIG